MIALRGWVFSLFVLVWCSVRAAAIVVVYGEQSVASGEKRFSKTLAMHVQRWYADAGIPVDMIPDSEFIHVETCQLAILVNCYAPSKRVIQTIERKLDAGMRFVVCYSASESLAKLFGLKPEAYLRNDKGAWSSMSFLENRPQGAPREVRQTSTNLFSMVPSGEETSGAVPMAWWCDRGGKRTSVAWWKTARGSYWMTHILTGDGDEEAKQRLLLAIAAECVPGIWSQAARFSYFQTIKMLTGGELGARIAVLPRSSARRKRAELAMGTVLKLKQRVSALLGQNTWVAYQSARDLCDSVARVYGMTYWPRRGEVCGVWDHSGQGVFPGEWERTAALLARYGITDVYVNVAGAAFALYPSRVLPQRGTEDVLRHAVEACHKYGLRVHAWVLCFSGERAAGRSVIAAFQQKQWMLQEVDGRDSLWLDPTNPEVRAYLFSAICEIAQQYAVDGIQLDFVRYPSLPQSVGQRIRARFEAVHGKVGKWPDDILKGTSSVRRVFLRWRAAIVTDWVQDVRTWLRLNYPELSLGAAVFGKYPMCIDSVGQDWLSWLRMGILDEVFPMNYTGDETKLKDWLGTQTADARLAGRIVSGIGVTAAESRLSPVQVLRQIGQIRRAKCKGFALFDLDESLRKNVLPVLSVGVTAHE